MVISKILGLSVNTLTTNDKNFLLNKNNLTQPVQMELSEKQKPVSHFFSEFLKGRSNLEDRPHILCIFENTHYERRGSINV